MAFAATGTSRPFFLASALLTMTRSYLNLPPLLSTDMRSRPIDPPLVLRLAANKMSLPLVCVVRPEALLLMLVCAYSAMPVPVVAVRQPPGHRANP